jgi:hypothetical protein
MPQPNTLNTIQRWMQSVITHPDGVVAGIASVPAANLIEVSVDQIEGVILPSHEMNSLDRLQIYGRAYFGRLIECLQAQFPAVRQAIGDEAFNGLAFGYLVQHPSTTYTLSKLGDAFDTFLAKTRPSPAISGQPDFADFLIDLAQLERTYSEVFNGQGPERSRSLDVTDFENMLPDQFAECRLIPYPCVRLLKLKFPVHDYATAIRLGTEPTIPDARQVSLVITRRNYVVRRFEVTEPQFELLSALIRQVTIGESLQSLRSLADIDVDNLVTQLHGWFRDWSATPLFAELQRP